MTEPSRREFLRGFGLRGIREIGAAAQAVGTPFQPDGSAGAVRPLLGSDKVTTAPAPPTWSPPRPAPRPSAVAATRCLELEHLADLVRTEMPLDRSAQILALVRRSVRMTPATGDPTRTEAWLDIEGATRLLDPLAGPVVLAAVSSSARWLIGTAVEGEGWLAVSLSGTGAPSAARLSAPGALAEIGVPMELSGHLMLPRVWSDPVEALELSAEERDAYARVYESLAQAQGLESDQSGGGGLAHHRLFGYPDETSGSMPARCVELRGAGDWRLLLQVSLPGHPRAYVWVPDGDLDRMVGLIQ